MTEQLWATWRLKYIEAASADAGQGTKPCIFCDFPAQDKANDAENYIVHRSERAYIILNAFPYSSGHLMVIPYRHTDTMDVFDDAELLDIMRLTRLGINLLKAAFKPDAFNLGVNMGRGAGAGIADHLHWHVVPRWNGDTNFMPVLADVRVIPDSLQNTYARLLAQLERTDPESSNIIS